MEIEIKSRSKELDNRKYKVRLNDKVHELINKICKDSGYQACALRLTKIDEKTNKHIKLNDLDTIEENKLLIDNKTPILYLKYLGPQIKWKNVFLIEYIGPIIIHLFFYHFVKLTKGIKYSLTVQTSFYMILIHFIKREFETLFVHKFSNETMPIFNLYKNSFHYWILGGLLISFFSYYYESVENKNEIVKFLFYINNLNEWKIFLLMILWLYAEISNYIIHVKLSMIRKNNPKQYDIPHGYGFKWVSCPNYFFEILSWFSYSMLIGNWTAWLFFAISFIQMWIWSKKKHKRYLLIFGDKYKKYNRKILIPHVY